MVKSIMTKKNQNVNCKGLNPAREPSNKRENKDKPTTLNGQNR